jgi:hypothetical protein
MAQRIQQPLEVLLPAEIILMIGNHLPFKSYIKFSQTCRTAQRILTTTNAIGYLNHRFKFGEDSGSLLLFTYYNTLHFPRSMSKIVLNHFISTTKNDNKSFLIKGWSLIHAIHCLDPGRFMTLLLADDESDNNDEEDDKSLAFIEKKKRLLAHHQRIFAREIIDAIIESHTSSKAEVVKSKTYQAVFKNLVQSGDLRTVENCLRSLGPPTIDSITINDSDYNNRFPLIDQNFVISTAGALTATTSAAQPPKSPIIEADTVEAICKDTLYLNFNAHEMRSLTEKLLDKSDVKVNNVSTKYISYNSNSNSIFNTTSFNFGSHHHHHHSNRQNTTTPTVIINNSLSSRGSNTTRTNNVNENNGSGTTNR